MIFGGAEIVLPMHFGRFFSKLIDDLGIKPPRLAELTGVEVRTAYRWKTLEKAPRGEGLVKIADALHIPFSDFRDAATGKSELAERYRDRTLWLKTKVISRGAGIGVDRKDDTRTGRVMEWFDAAPTALQHVILGEVPRGTEAEYLRHITAYFREQLTPRARAAAVPTRRGRR